MTKTQCDVTTADVSTLTLLIILRNKYNAELYNLEAFLESPVCRTDLLKLEQRMKDSETLLDDYESIEASILRRVTGASLEEFHRYNRDEFRLLFFETRETGASIIASLKKTETNLPRNIQTNTTIPVKSIEQNKEESPSQAILAIPSKSNETVITPLNGVPKSNLPARQSLIRAPAKGTVDVASAQVVKPAESGRHIKSSIGTKPLIHFQERVGSDSYSNTARTAKQKRQPLTISRDHPRKPQDLKHSQHLVSMPDITTNVTSINFHVKQAHGISKLKNTSIGSLHVTNIHQSLHGDMQFVYYKMVRFKANSTHFYLGLAALTKGVRAQ